jgi:hypothetical protein
MSTYRMFIVAFERQVAQEFLAGGSMPCSDAPAIGA